MNAAFKDRNNAFISQKRLCDSGIFKVLKISFTLYDIFSNLLGSSPDSKKIATAQDIELALDYANDNRSDANIVSIQLL